MAKGKKLQRNRKKKKLSHARVARILENISNAKCELFYYSYHPDEFLSKTRGTALQISSLRERLERYEKKLYA